MKKIFLEQESQKQMKQDNGQKPSAMMAVSIKYKNKPGNIYCLNCKDHSDHIASKCPWREQGYERCYFCNWITNHISRDCPERRPLPQNNRNMRRGGRNSSNNQNSRGAEARTEETQEVEEVEVASRMLNSNITKGLNHTRVNIITNINLSNSSW
ncbi:hypothetical protein QAD02_007972 [Eretmocerus hayati]|uniref:Uncharacterized protein n=1 Tax=Eretmocerus hayati TaxID=131215 RepID=A0ACC2N547_9HYME|nr:hypothetical protein QAD02_007972 [Eretmocerus hayati]